MKSLRKVLPMNKPRIVIVAPHLIAAGVETSLINLLKELERYDLSITLLLARRAGAFLDRVPSSVTVREIEMPTNARAQLFRGGFIASVRHYARTFHFLSLIRLIFNRLSSKEIPELLDGFEMIPKERGEFDIAIAYHIHMPFIPKYVSENIMANKKIAFVHNDLRISRLNIRPMRTTLMSFSRIFAVSSGIAEEMRKALPECADRISVFLNILDTEDILRKAEIDLAPFAGYEGKHLLTVARLESQKGIDIAIDAFAKCASRKLGAKWFIIGAGSLEKKLMKKAQKLGVADSFIFLGERKNPYPYVKSCDLYIQPSRHEGLCVSVQEARVLGKPIIVSDVVGLRELIEDGRTGKIVACESDSIAKAIDEMLFDDEKLEAIKGNLDREQRNENIRERIEFLLN